MSLRPSKSQLFAASAILLCWGIVGPIAPAFGQASTPTVQELQRQLQQRDQAIAILRRRLDALEKRLEETERLARAKVETAQPIVVEPRPSPAPAAVSPAPPSPGPRPPGQVEVDPLAAERALERALVRTGALLLSPGLVEVEPSLLYQRTDRAHPVLFFGGGGAIVGVGDRRVERDLLQAELTVKVGLPFESQFELSLPYNIVDQALVDRQALTPVGARYGHGAGLGDVKLAFAKTLVQENGWIPDLVGRVSWDTATGERADNRVGLPAGFHEVQAQLVAIKRNDPLAFLLSGSYQYAFENDDIKPGRQIGLTFGTVLATSPSTSLRATFETTFGTPLEINGRELKGSEITAATLNLGASIVLAPRILFDIVGSLGLTDDAPDYAIKLSLPIRFDTPFF